MSQHTVGIVIDKLLTDEDLRIRFVIDRMETLAALCLEGFELSPNEIDLFCRTDARLWFWAGATQGALQHWAARRS
jgi:hypothetical protein